MMEGATQNLKRKLLNLLKKVSDGLASLRGSPAELYKAYIMKFLDSYSYFSMSITLTLFLSEDFGLSDVEAGTIYGVWGGMITVYGLFVGFVVDNIGVAASLRLGFTITLLSRLFMFATTSKWVMLFILCVTLPIGNSLGIPVLTTGMRRYTHPGNRSFAIGLFYVIMNVAALLAGPLVDFCTISYNVKSAEDKTMWVLTSYRLILLMGIVANVIAVLISFTVREIKLECEDNSLMKATNESYQDDYENEDGATDSASKIASFTPVRGSMWTILKETFAAKRFWRFLIVCLITSNVRMVFRHMDATLPKYLVREFGEKTPKGLIYAINPAIIITLVPIMTAATANIDPLVCIHFGTYVSAASVFSLALSNSIAASVLFVTILSIGESIWSPRFYDYSLSMAPEGREGTYMAMSSAPLFLAKLPVGFISGWLIQKYCPEEGESHPQMMWLIIGAGTIISPILLTVLWSYISKKDDDDYQITSKKELNSVIT